MSEEANDAFIDVVEDYFDQDAEVLAEDERPEVHYQGASYSVLLSAQTAVIDPFLHISIYFSRTPSLPFAC